MTPGVPKRAFVVPLLVVGAALAASCRSTPPAATGSNPPAATGYVEADVRFMQGMIPHHAQAIEMADLVEDRTGNPAIHRLAERIEISQRDEIARMRRWLEARGESAPDPDAHHHGPLMPGMIDAEGMERLAAARDAAFDRLFLELMIEHHRGALVMVEALHESGAGAEPELFLLVSHIDADQRAEIARMRGMLETPSGGTE